MFLHKMNYIAKNLSLWVNAYLILNNHLIYFLLLLNTLSHDFENILIWKWTRMFTPFVYWKTFLNISRQIIDCTKEYKQYNVSLNLIGYFRCGIQTVALWLQREVSVVIRNILWCFSENSPHGVSPTKKWIPPT